MASNTLRGIDFLVYYTGFKGGSQDERNGFFLNRQEMNGCRLIGLKWIIRLSEGVLFSIIYNLLQFFPIDRRFHRILNRNPSIQNVRQCVRNNLARPVSDAIQLRQFCFDFFEFRKKGFALRF